MIVAESYQVAGQSLVPTRRVPGTCKLNRQKKKAPLTDPASRTAGLLQGAPVGNELRLHLVSLVRVFLHRHWGIHRQNLPTPRPVNSLGLGVSNMYRESQGTSSRRGSGFVWPVMYCPHPQGSAGPLASRKLEPGTS